MSKRAIATCEDCYFRRGGSVRPPREHTVPNLPGRDRQARSARAAAPRRPGTAASGRARSRRIRSPRERGAAPTPAAKGRGASPGDPLEARVVGGDRLYALVFLLLNDDKQDGRLRLLHRRHTAPLADPAQHGARRRARDHRPSVVAEPQAAVAVERIGRRGVLRRPRRRLFTARRGCGRPRRSGRAARTRTRAAPSSHRRRGRRSPMPRTNVTPASVARSSSSAASTPPAKSTHRK